jgi:hypothetical protein
VPHHNRGRDDLVSCHQGEVKPDLGAQRLTILGQAERASNHVGAGEDLTLAGEETGTHDTPVPVTQAHHGRVELHGHAGSRSIPCRVTLKFASPLL